MRVDIPCVTKFDFFTLIDGHKTCNFYLLGTFCDQLLQICN